MRQAAARPSDIDAQVYCRSIKLFRRRGESERREADPVWGKHDCFLAESCRGACRGRASTHGSNREVDWIIELTCADENNCCVNTESCLHAPRSCGDCPQ